MVSSPTSANSGIYSNGPSAGSSRKHSSLCQKVTNDAGAIRLLHDLVYLGIALQPFVKLVSSPLSKTAAELYRLFGRQREKIN